MTEQITQEQQEEIEIQELVEEGVIHVGNPKSLLNWYGKELSGLEFCKKNMQIQIQKQVSVIDRKIAALKYHFNSQVQALVSQMIHENGGRVKTVHTDHASYQVLDTKETVEVVDDESFFSWLDQQPEDIARELEDAVRITKSLRKTPIKEYVLGTESTLGTGEEPDGIRIVPASQKMNIKIGGLPKE